MGTAEQLAITERFASALPATDLAQKILDPDSDEALMLRYREGDFPAFETLYRRHNQRLFRFVAWQSPRIDWADEVAQDTWLRLHASRASYRPDAQFKTFLYQIAKNRLIDLMRQKNALLASDLGSGHDNGESLFDHILDQYGDDAGPEAALSQRDRRRMLHDAIHTLPQDQKEALILHQFSEMSLEEIARLTAAPVETVKSRLRYAMRKLRQQLQDE